MPVLPYVYTYCDALDALVDFAQGQGVGAPPSALRRCVRRAYEDLFQAHEWSFANANGRLRLYKPQTTGTVAFDLTGGTYERELTLTGATFPTWTVDAAIRFSNLVCDIESVKSDTIATLDPVMCPIADVASTTYSLYPRWYILPADFGSFRGPMDELTSVLGRYVPPEDILALDRYWQTTDVIDRYSIGPAQDLYGNMALYVPPGVGTDRTLDFVYKRRPRPLRYTGQNPADYQGTISVSAGSTAVTGVGTAFHQDLIGAIFRIGSGSLKPTGLDGLEPYMEQRSVAAVGNTTTLTLDAAVVTTRQAVKYVVSDPIDLDQSCWNTFLRVAEREFAMTHSRVLPPLTVQMAIRAAEESLIQAKADDCRLTEVGVMGEDTRTRYERLWGSNYTELP